MGLLCCGLAPVWAQDLVPDPVIAKIEPLLQSESPALRGEAALALATTRLAKYYTPILALTADREAPARHRALLALGYLQQPESEVVFARILRKAPRDSLDRAVAALALGLLPDQPRLPSIDAFFVRAAASSRKRIRPELASLLLGMTYQDHPSRLATLVELVDDATYRNRTVLALVLDNLAKLPAGLDLDRLWELARSPNEAVACAALQTLARPRTELQKAQRRRLVKMTRHRRASTVRAAALRVLTVKRLPEALTVAGEFLAAEDPVLTAIAVDTILTLGGGILRESLEERILSTKRPDLQAAMLGAKTGPHTDDFVKRCLALARDRTLDPQRRTRAAKIVAEAGWKEIIPTLTTLFLASDQPATVNFLAKLLRTLDVDVGEKIFPTTSVEDTHRLPIRLRALLAAEHEQALGLVVKILAAPATAIEMRTEVVRAYRVTQVEALPGASLDLIPQHIRELIR